MALQSKLRVRRDLLLAALLLAASCRAAPDAPRTRDAGPYNPIATPREPLSPQLRALLAARMRRHGREMSALMRAVVTLDWADVRRQSERLLAEPSIAPPLADEPETLNARLPPAFFVRQQALLDALRELHAAAAQRSDHALKVAFNGVAGACLDCHAAYLAEPQQPRLFQEPAP